MTVKVKLLDRNLVRHFGGVIQSMDTGMAKRYVDQGKAIYENSDSRKMESGPPRHKAVFQAPEDKAMENFSNHRYPGPDDALFPKTNEG
jgi:hypothetical protein